MPNYNQPHQFYAGVDLHARSMFVHVLNAKGKTVFERDLAAEPDAFLDAVKPFRKNLVVGCECMFAWYWLADLCEDKRIPFVLGHALAMKHIHGGKAKSDKIDAGKLANMLRGGMFPLAYVYPRQAADARSVAPPLLLRAQRGQLITHIVNTNSQFNLPPFSKKLSYAANRTEEIATRFTDPSTRLMISADLNLIDAYDAQIAEVERHLLKSAKVDDPVTFAFLRTIPGIGPILGLILLYEIDRIGRFPEAGNFLSYSRLVRCATRAPARSRASAARRSATPTSSGPSARPPA